MLLYAYVICKSKSRKEGNVGCVGSWTKSQFGLTMCDTTISLLTPSTKNKCDNWATHDVSTVIISGVEISASVTSGNLFSGNFFLIKSRAELIPSVLPSIEQIFWSLAPGWSFTYIWTCAFVRMLCKKLPWWPINLPTSCCGIAK